MTLPARMLELVVAPSQDGQTVSKPAPPFSQPLACVAVLASPAEASAAAAATALALARRARSSCALAVSWGATGDDPPPAGALPASARLARRVRTSGLPAVAAGQLVRVAVDGAQGALIAAWNLLARESVPMAVALAGPRSEELDELLRSTDAIVVVAALSSPAGLVQTAVADAQAIGPPVASASVRLGPATRGLLALGYGVPPRIRAAIDEALR